MLNREKKKVNVISYIKVFNSIQGTPNRLRRGDRGMFVSQNSSVTEAPSDEVEQEQENDDEQETARVTT